MKNSVCFTPTSTVEAKQYLASSLTESIRNYFSVIRLAFKTLLLFLRSKNFFFEFKYHSLYFLLFLLVGFSANSQTLTLKEAVQTALNNYGTIKAKANYLKASQASEKGASTEHLPNLLFGAQQSYGTANGQIGPLISTGGLTTAGAGSLFSSQNWNAAFGSLYLLNINWDFFTFGRINERIKVSQAEVIRETTNLEQEKFQHQVRVAGAYLNLLAAQRLRLSQQKNLDRANALRAVVVVRAKNGLNPGVDSSLANAEVSSAKIDLNNAIDFEQQQGNQLAQLMGIAYRDFLLDTLFVYRIPNALYDSSSVREGEHPVLKYYRSRIDVSTQQEKYYGRFRYPVFSLIGVLQTRGSGFENNYSELHPDAYTRGYWNGVKPDRANYLVGVGVTWNLTNLKRVQHQVDAQAWTSKGLQDEYELVNQQIKTQLSLSDQRMKNALANYTEAPVQLTAASDAYLQKSVLYRNGLATIVDITQALFTLNRAETDKDISINNVWQALLLKAAASGDFSLFINEF